MVAGATRNLEELATARECVRRIAVCGVAAIVGVELDRAGRAIEAMCDHMTPRGPDDRGSKSVGPEGLPVLLGSTRLSIIDPSPAGHQPMCDEERGNWIVFNGMIYNFRTLRRELEAAGERFRSECDTEVVLRAYGRWGRAGIKRLEGMFAFAIWDAREGHLVIARDRLGIKPLYYHQREGRLIVASQVKTLIASGLVPPRLSPAGIRTFLETGAVNEPLTAIEGVRALPPGTIAVSRGGKIVPERFWEPPPTSATYSSQREAAVDLREELERSVGRHLVSDAPLGIFLSGGMDSSMLAVLARLTTSDITTVSVVFDDKRFSEAPFMDAVSRSVGSNHVQVVLRPEELLSSLDSVFDAMDQPTFDGVNTFAVARAAAQAGLKVALAGVGADELFDGYDYVGRTATLERLKRLPSGAQRLALSTLSVWPQNRIGRAKVESWLGESFAQGDSYELLRRLWLPEEIDGVLPTTQDADPAVYPSLRPNGGRSRSVALLELRNYMRNVLLRDIDAMSMANSLEVRVPYLDDSLVNWALQLPDDVRGRGKSILAAAGRGLLADPILERRKQGFVLPIADWMRRELRDDVADVVADPPSDVADLIDPRFMLDTWRDFELHGRRWLRPWALFALCRWTAGIKSDAAAAAAAA